MATYSTGVTASFAGSGFSEIVGLSVSYGGGLPEDIDGTWKAILGQVRIETLSPVSASLWGTSGSIAISGGGVSLTAPAICTEVSAVGEVNGLTRYSLTCDLIG